MKPRASTAPPIHDLASGAPDSVAGPAPARPRSSGPDQRIHVRFDKLFTVMVGSELYGDSPAVARNISAGGMLVEMAFPLPLGSVVSVHFQCDREGGDADEIVARAEVKHHYCLNFTGGGEPSSTRAIGLRFLDFDDDIPPERLLDGWTRETLLH